MSPSMAIRFSIASYEEPSTAKLTEFARDSFRRLSDFFPGGLISFTDVYWNVTPRRAPYQRFDKVEWAQLSRSELENLKIEAGDEEMWSRFVFQYWAALEEKNLPHRYEWYLDKSLTGAVPSRALQASVVELAKDAFVHFHGCTGYISFDHRTDPQLFTSPYEDLIRVDFGGQHMTELREKLRGYYWGNFLTDRHVGKIGGLSQLRKIPHHDLVNLPNGYYLQLTPDMVHIPKDALMQAAATLAPLLPQPFPDRAPLAPSPFRHLLDVPWSGGSPPETNAIDQSAHEEQLTQHIYSLSQRNDQPEALTWLDDNPNPDPLAGNRFAGKEEVRAFVRRIYTAGAESVRVTMIHSEKERVAREGGPYAESLLIQMPHDSEKRKAICRIVEEEYQAEGFLDEEEHLSEDIIERDWIALWWD